MSLCEKCRFKTFSQFTGYPGIWLCFHPYRGELDNRGKWSYPKIDSPNITICICDPKDDAALALRKAETPRWCYFEALKRAKANDPSFDAESQRKSLEWPSYPGADIWDLNFLR